VEEIVVTARQREESLQEIPLAISAFTSDDIKKAGFQNLGDIALQSAGIQFNPNMSGTQAGRLNSIVRMRGIQGGLLANNQAVSLFVDGVFAMGGATVLPIQDLERVEIIRGPQSAFFGRNTFAGAINYITKKPQLDAYEGQISFSGATYDSYEVSLQHTGPLVNDRLGYLANVRLYNKGSMYTATDGGKLGKETSKTASLALLAAPNDSIDVKVRAFFQKDDDGPSNQGYIRGRTNDSCSGTTVQGLNAAGQPITISPRRYICGKIPKLGSAAIPRVSTNTSLRPQIFSLVRPGRDNELGRDLPPAARTEFLIEQLVNRQYIPGVPKMDGFGMERETFRSSLNANWEFADGYLATLTAGYNDMRVNWLIDYDNYDVESWWSADPQKGKDKSAELRVASPGKERFRWLTGATYYQQTYITNGAGGLAISACTTTTCAVGPSNFGLPITGGDKAKVWAVYGSLSYDIIVEQLTIDVEFRYMQDERTNTQAVGTSFRAFTEKFKQKTPRVILTYKPSEATTIYAQASRGTLPGVINGLVSICSNDAFTVPFIVPAGLPGAGTPSTASECAQIASQLPGGALIPSTPAQYLDAGEIGLKQSFLDGTARVNLTGYYYKWKNQPYGLTIRYFRDADNPALRDRIPNAFSNTLGVQTSGSSKSKGAEIEVAMAPSENWNFGGTLGWNDNHYTELILTGGFTTEVYGSTNYKGKTQTRYPEWQGSLSATYTDAFVGDWTWFARSDAIYFGKAWSDIGNLSYSDDYWLVHARAGLEREALRVELYVRNLLQEKGWSGANNRADFGVQGDLTFFAQGISVAPQDKRQFGLRVNYTF
ncbi:MAG: TonB-dependent receptor, partial [Rhodospirillaceae bacterium]|nr:TonB-dependent receptor [Rhodospirillaceae bacterium]